MFNFMRTEIENRRRWSIPSTHVPVWCSHFSKRALRTSVKITNPLWKEESGCYHKKRRKRAKRYQICSAYKICADKICFLSFKKKKVTSSWPISSSPDHHFKLKGINKTHRRIIIQKFPLYRKDIIIILLRSVYKYCKIPRFSAAEQSLGSLHLLQ